MGKVAPATPAAVTAHPAQNTSAPMSAIDHALVISSRPPGLRPGDHVLSVGSKPEDHVLPSAAKPEEHAPPTLTSGVRPGDHVLVIRPASSVAAAPAPSGNAPLPAASRPEARQTPAATSPAQAASNPVPAAQPQPITASTSSKSPASYQVPAPAVTPRLSPIDHVLLVSVHPPGMPGSAASVDHAFPAVISPPSPNGWTPGRGLLASLELPEGHHLTEGQALLMETPDESCRDPISWSVIIHKSSYLVEVYYKGKHFDSFPAVFGRNPDHSAKEWEGDLRTPEGTYVIIDKYYTPRWKWFLRLNYPNYDDRARYDTMLGAGLVPVINGHLRHLGGAIGIHGTDRPSFNRTRINWTLGCISVDNDAIEELDRVLPIGTLVIIKQ